MVGSGFQRPTSYPSPFAFFVGHCTFGSPEDCVRFVPVPVRFRSSYMVVWIFAKLIGIRIFLGLVMMEFGRAVWSCCNSTTTPWYEICINFLLCRKMGAKIESAGLPWTIEAQPMLFRFLLRPKYRNGEHERPPQLSGVGIGFKHAVYTVNQYC